MSKVLHKALSLVFGVLGGMVAHRVFERLWTAVGGQSEPPAPDEQGRSWRAVVLAAGLQGASYGVIRALVQKGSAEAVKRNTGTWPGQKQSQ
ncbi:MAG: DUF4235 domain-containing protein [Baekduiaceae bacterium]